MSSPDPTTPPPAPPPHATPDSVISSTALARTLTISDQHATILLTSSTSQNDDGTDAPATRSLLKLTLVPFHKIALSCVSTTTDEAKSGDRDEDGKKEEENETAAKMEEHSNSVLKFLSKFDWRMTSESGAEYSYYEASAKNESKSSEEDGSEPNVKRIKIDADVATVPEGGKAATTDKSTATWTSFKAELISPASDRQVARAMPSPGLSMIVETPSLYAEVTKPYIEEIVSSGSLSWIQNLVEVRKEKERLLLNADQWILNVDTKWRTHPDCLTVPRSEWFRHESIIDLYCLGITKVSGVASLRDLTADHLPMLRDMAEKGPAVIEELYGVKPDQLRVFVHYQPQFYHFHVHFTRLENDTGCQAEKAHLLSDIIQNLEMDSDFYKKRTITYKLSLKDKLYKVISAASIGGENEKKETAEEMKTDENA